MCGVRTGTQGFFKDHQSGDLIGIACRGMSEGRAFAEPLLAKARGRCCETVKQRILNETKLEKFSQREQVTKLK